jgi:hypothetical protein
MNLTTQPHLLPRLRMFAFCIHFSPTCLHDVSGTSPFRSKNLMLNNIVSSWRLVSVLTKFYPIETCICKQTSFPFVFIVLNNQKPYTKCLFHVFWHQSPITFHTCLKPLSIYQLLTNIWKCKLTLTCLTCYRTNNKCIVMLIKIRYILNLL